jgi:hypothetical protein
MNDMENKLLKKLRGYQKANRERFMLLMMQVLTLEEYIVYEFGIAITDWDDSESHRETYGTFQATNGQIAEILGWKSDSQVSRIRNRLIEKDFFIKDGNRYRAKDFEKWQLRKNPLAKTQRYSANPQYQPANMQGDVAKMQGFQAYDPDHSLVSSKGNVVSSSFNEVINDYRSNDEDVSPEDIPF